MFVYRKPKTLEDFEKIVKCYILNEYELKEVCEEVKKELNIEDNDFFPQMEIIVKEIEVSKARQYKTEEQLKLSLKELIVKKVQEKFSQEQIKYINICAIGFNSDSLSYHIYFNHINEKGN